MDVVSVVIAIIFFVVTLFGKRINDAARKSARQGGAPAGGAARAAVDPRIDRAARQQMVQPSAAPLPSAPIPLDVQDPVFRAASRRLVLVAVGLIAAIVLAAAWFLYLRGALGG